jgi:hypothetical protein
VVEVRARPRVVTGRERGVALALERVLVVGRSRGGGEPLRASLELGGQATHGGLLVGELRAQARHVVAAGGSSAARAAPASRCGRSGSGRRRGPRRARQRPSDGAAPCRRWPGSRGMGRSTARLGATASSAAVSSTRRALPREGGDPLLAVVGGPRLVLEQSEHPALLVAGLHLEHRADEAVAAQSVPAPGHLEAVASRPLEALDLEGDTSETTSGAGICCRATPAVCTPSRHAPLGSAPAGRNASRRRARYTEGCAPSPPPLHVLLGPAAALRRGVARARAPSAPRARRRAREALLLVLVLAVAAAAAVWLVATVITAPTCAAARRRASPPRGRGATRPRCGSARQAQPRSLSAARVRTPRALGRERSHGAERARRSRQRAARRALRVPVAMPTRTFGTLRGTIVLPVHAEDGAARIAWAPHLRLPGLRAGEQVRRVGARAPDARATCWAPTAGRWPPTRPLRPSQGARRRAATAAAASSASTTSAWPAGPARSCASATRVVATVKRRRGRSVHATIRPGLQRAAAAALGGKLGGVAVVRPRDGSVLALAGLAVSAPQPPGSTFKIITLSGRPGCGGRHAVELLSVRTSATLSGVRLRNAAASRAAARSRRPSSTRATRSSRRSGAKLGASALVRMAEAFGFNERPRVPDAKASTIPPAREADRQPRRRRQRHRPGPRPAHAAADGGAWGDDRRARPPRAPAHRAQRQGAAPARGQRARRRAGARDDARRRALGHGDGRRDPGVQVAGKTGTAELRPNSTEPQGRRCLVRRLRAGLASRRWPWP